VVQYAFSQEMVLLYENKGSPYRYMKQWRRIQKSAVDNYSLFLLSNARAERNHDGPKLRFMQFWDGGSAGAFSALPRPARC